MKAIILGSGPSARGFVKPDGIFTIAVNGAIEQCPEADAFFTLDHSPENMRRLNELPSWVTGYVAFPDNIQTPPHIIRYKRLFARGMPEPEQKNTQEWWFWRWNCGDGLSEETGSVNTGNSAFGALGVLYHLGYTHVALVGVDGTQDAKPDGSLPKNLSHLGILFATARFQINITSCGKLDSVRMATLSEWLSE